MTVNVAVFNITFFREPFDSLFVFAQMAFLL